MNWTECVRYNESWGLLSRFEWPVGPGRFGFDCNPDAFTISDLTGAVGWTWTYPGDYILSLPDARTFFELGNVIIAGHGFSYFLPILFFPAVIVGGYVLGLVIAIPFIALAWLLELVGTPLQWLERLGRVVGRLSRRRPRT